MILIYIFCLISVPRSRGSGADGGNVRGRRVRKRNGHLRHARALRERVSPTGRLRRLEVQALPANVVSYNKQVLTIASATLLVVSESTAPSFDSF